MTLKLALAFGFALALTISCSMDSITNTLKEMDKSPSSSSNGGDNKPDDSSCDRQSGVIYDLPVNYKGETYQTVVIGSQIWMAKNLNYNASGSLCYGNKPANCTTYGRLYDWETAKKVCPPGWHLPSNADWDKLVRYVDGSTSTESPYQSETAGKYLKATTGWNDGDNGTDNYGFAALPGGFFESTGVGVGHSTMEGDLGHWWSSSESSSYQAYCRLTETRYYSYNADRFIAFGIDNKLDMLSVRCLRDNDKDVSCVKDKN